MVKTDYSGNGPLAGYSVNLTLPLVELATVNYYNDHAFTSGLSQLDYVTPTPSITYENAFHFVDRADVDNEYSYDANGNLTKDLNKNITSITYNVLNLPSVITFADDNTITYGYDAAGSKLSVACQSGGTTVRISRTIIT